MDSQLAQYIQLNLAQGVNQEDIKNALLQKGWTLAQIQPYFITQASINTQVITKKEYLLAPIIIRFGLAFVFLYAAIFVSSSDSSGSTFVPTFIQNLIPIHLFLMSFTVFEVGLALWLLSGKFVRYSGLLAAWVLLCITMFNLWDFHLLFRNIAIASAAVALALNGMKVKL